MESLYLRRRCFHGGTIVASSTAVAEPVYVRYGWANSPQCNLFNSDGLPASPFTSVK